MVWGIIVWIYFPPPDRFGLDRQTYYPFLGLTVRPLIQNTNDTTLKKKLKFGHSTDFYGFSFIKTVFVFVWKINLFFFFRATWCHLASTFFYEWALVVRDQPKREKEAEREREKSEKQQTTIHTHTERENIKKFLNVEKKISKILCGCTNPITSNNMAPTDHCRTQPVEHRLGRNDR